MDKEKGKLALKHLIDRYNSNKHLKDFISNEKQISRSLIEPFVRDVLGWDIEDPQEFKVEVPASGKRVDILVCINGVTQFIVEAKSLTQDIVDYNDFYKQTISYAHSKEKTFAILTNFKHFIILRCDVEVDNPLKAAVKIINIENYTDDDFDLLYNFSKEIWVEKGEENPLYLKLANFKRRAKVDVELLENLKEWRQSIINNINKHPRQNKYDFSDEKSKYEVEEEIQRFLDRVIFICYTEDKGFVDSELKSLIELKKDKHYESQSWLLDKIRSIFKKYWNEYNSDLFKLGKCDEFFIEDAVLLKILTDLRKPKDRLPYDFASIEADILGKTYENFIGHVIAGEKRFKEKESKGKRKSEGIYYTPTYIVDYIVRNTVKEYIKGKSFASINKVKILDPACGSGSFLIKAFDALAEESRNILKRDLNYEEKKNLMLNCIHGVDKDERAVDICKLNLSLKLAERGQKLPPLHDNIKCGDSLIDDKEIADYKAFNWEEEFKEIMRNSGFGVVIGNPPYVDIKQLPPQIVRYLFKKYTSVENRMNLYSTFVEKSLYLLRENGRFGFIIPNSILYNESYSKIRDLLLNNSILRNIVRLPDNVFGSVKVETIILIYQKSNKNTEKENCEVLIYPREAKINSINKEAANQALYFNQNKWNVGRKIINISLTTMSHKLLNKIEEGTKPLIELCDFSLGLTPYDKYKGHTKKQIESRIFHSTTKKNETFKPLLSGENITRYGVFRDKKEYISYGDWLGAQREQRFFTKPRILVRQILSGKPQKIYAGYTEKEFYNTQIAFNILVKNENTTNTKFILSIFNSKLMNYYHKEKCLDPSKSLFQKILIVNAKKFPIKIITLNNQLPFVKLADKMLSLNKKLQEIGDKNTLEKQKIEQEIKKTDNEIDELVYELYGITEEEKKIIEESLK